SMTEYSAISSIGRTSISAAHTTYGSASFENRFIQTAPPLKYFSGHDVDILREERKPDLASFLHIIRSVDLKLAPRGREGDPVYPFFYIFRLKIIVHAQVNAHILIA